MTYTDNKVKVTVIESHCPKYKEGDVIRFVGSDLDKENSANVCMVAMQAIYPFIYAFRRGGNLKNGPYQCIDCGETVIFNIEIDKLSNDSFEKSCGAILYKLENKEIKYLLVEEASGALSFPKGHMEEGETEQETALREIQEETDLKVELIDDFRATEQYQLSEKPGVTKQVVYFLAEYTDKKPRIVRPEEVRSLKSFSLDEAMAVIEHENKRELLRKADNYIKEKLN